MFIDKDEFIIRCGCHDVSHPVWFSISRASWEPDSEPDEMFISLQVPDVGLWGRIKMAVKYLIHGSKRFWCYGDICLLLSNPNERSEIVGLHKYLGMVIAESEPAKVDP